MREGPQYVLVVGDDRFRRMASTIRRLRERVEGVEDAWLCGEWPLGIEPPEAGKRIAELFNETVELRARAEQAERVRELLRCDVIRYRAMLFPLSQADRIEKEEDR